MADNAPMEAAPSEAPAGAPAGAAAPPPPDPAVVAEALKEEATALYRAGDYARAGDKYSAAIAAAPSAGLFLNRAAAAMMRSRYEDAARDCGTAAELDPRNLKAYVRGAKALTALGRYEEAASVLGQGLVRDPRSDELLEERKATELAKTRVERAKVYLAEVRTQGGGRGRRRVRARVCAAPRHTARGRAWHCAPPWPAGGVRVRAECVLTCDVRACVQGAFSRALSTASSVREASPASTLVTLLCMEAMIGLKQFDEAVLLSSEEMRARGTNSRLLHLRARALYHQVRACTSRSRWCRVPPPWGNA